MIPYAVAFPIQFNPSYIPSYIHPKKKIEKMISATTRHDASFFRYPIFLPRLP